MKLNLLKMYTITQLLEKKFQEALITVLGQKVLSHRLSIKKNKFSQFGDYQINDIIFISKLLNVNTRFLAEKILSNIDLKGIVSKISVTDPGFINITIDNNYISNYLNTMMLKNPKKSECKIVIDYSSPNLAKEMHVGHLRSTIIGDSLVRLYEYLGYTVIRRNHVGDWGTQFGMIIAYLQKTNNHNIELLNNLEDVYKNAKAYFDKNSTFACEAREYVVKLQSGDQETRNIWKKFVEMSIQHCQKIYDRLNIKLNLHDIVGESTYHAFLPKIVDTLVKNGIAINDNGAKCIFFSPGELYELNEQSPLIVQKSDGAYLYSTTDLAAIYDRVYNLHADILIYVIDVRQSIYLKQLFIAAKKAGIAKKATILKHVVFGAMLNEENKPFQTRAGNTIKLISLLDEAVSRAFKIIQGHNPTWNDCKIAQLAEILGIASIKYADLSKNRVSDYVFSFDKMLKFEGNTAPYLLYAYVRVMSIFRKIGLCIDRYSYQRIIITNNTEHNLAMHMITFFDILLQAADEYNPHYICTYLYDLAGLFMKFYEICPIIKEENSELQHSRLTLSIITSKIMKTGLELLGIEAVDYM